MAHLEQSFASWNPALRPEDGEPPIAPDSSDLSTTISNPSTIEQSIHNLEQTLESQPVEHSLDSDLSKPDLSVEIPETAVLDVTNPEPDSAEKVPSPDQTLNKDQDNTQALASASINNFENTEAPYEDDTSIVVPQEDESAVTHPIQNAPDLSWAGELNNEEAMDNVSASWGQANEDEVTPVTNGGIDATSRDLWGSPTSTGGGDDFFNQLKTQTKPIYVPPESESRYEEGVPLLEDTVSSPTEQSPNQESHMDEIFGGDEDEEGDFFSQVQQQSAPENEARPSLHVTRKSTSQVIESLDASTKSPTSEASPTAQEFNDILAAAASENPTEKAPSDDNLAARWQAELSEDEIEEKPARDDLAALWDAELDDDDMLLEDEGPRDQDVPDGVPPALSSPFGTPESSARAKPQPITSYTPHQPSTSDLLQGIPTQSFAPQANAVPAPSYFAPPPEPRPPTNRAESFAERSKEGYKSPYDLPDGLARPRRPAGSQKAVVLPGSGNVPPQGGNILAPPSSTSPATSLPMGTPPTAAPPMNTPPSTTVAAPKNFYEELPPPPPKPQSRPASSGRYAPSPDAVTSSFSQPPPPPVNSYAGLPAVSQQPGDISMQNHLQYPEKTDPYAGLLAPNAPSVPSATHSAARYSPKPPSLQPGMKPPASPRYSPAPPQAAAPPAPRRYASQPSLPFQPRTSSPLAYHEKASYQPQEVPRKHSLAELLPDSTPQIAVPHQSNEPESIHSAVPNSAVVALEAPGELPPVPHQMSPPRNVYAPPQASPPRNPYAPPTYINDFSQRIGPMGGGSSVSAPPASETQFMPPRRSQTQSPTQLVPGPRLSVPSIDPLQRPASVHGSGSPTKTASPYAPAQGPAHLRVPSLSSQELEFIPPSDGQELDPHQRWRGAPIVKFGFGGTITSCFPKHIPRYTAGQAAPKIKPSPGEVKVCQLRDWMPPTESIVPHPGPLKNKSKKKELLAWLSSKIAQFENEGIAEAAQLHPDSHKRHDEKVLLWKIIRILVEHDGSFEGSEDITKALRGVIFPDLQQSADSDQTYGTSIPSSGAFKPLGAPSQPDAVNSQTLETLRENLLLGDREKAVWGAVDSRLWGHAMIIASTLDKSVWKQVVQEFVRREVRSTTGNTESLAALYEIFAGNIEESIDELVPPSARAGLQMISKVDGHGSSKNAFDGLDSWRDTVGLVLSNRSPEDHQALLALGRLLLSYGRVEAAHICFIFSRASVFGGADDPQSSIVLLGADHKHLSTAVLQDEDAFLLTEAYEYATTTLANHPMAALPHLLAFKLLHAWDLADRGQKSEAQQYCDAIATSLKSVTKPSGYHNQFLFFGVDELSARLRQTASDGGSSWISKPSMEKVSGSMWAKFNSFVAGDDSDAASTGSGKAGDGDVGPFARFTSTPTVSRSPSVTDLYGPYAASAAQPIPSSGPSRYQPSNQYAPNSSPEQPRGRSSMDSQRSASFGPPLSQRRGSQEPATPVDNNFYQGGAPYGSPPAVGYQSTPPQTSYMPLAPVEEDFVTQSYPPAPSEPAYGSPMNASPYLPSGDGSFAPPIDQGSATDFQAGDSGYMPPDTGFGFSAPFIETTHASDDEEPAGPEIRKKKSFMADDEDNDDMAARTAAVAKAERDRENDENFRKIAEAEAKNAQQTQKKSWWPGWFGGGKKEEIPAGGGPIRAKLGEENSFYYDKELKKWVNKKDPNSATPVSATPPPPKGPAPPSRTASGSSVPPPPSPMPLVGADSRPSSSTGGPPGPSSLSSSPALGIPPPFLGAGPRSVSTGAAVPTPPGSSAGAPPRPATSLSNASSIDDLLGAPTARRGGAARSKKKGRYVDVMAK
ncbi:vesicle coat component [Aspergillus nanangensis]|uniref:Protein transport protein sec16 n=1 Tax=Aspergillus nanangensis TaxID=2582783 RepID=A0AAD4CRP0_ASPNN|nr:vesicle coat component [Aspergillus nanangensis]